MKEEKQILISVLISVQRWLIQRWEVYHKSKTLVWFKIFSMTIYLSIIVCPLYIIKYTYIFIQSCVCMYVCINLFISIHENVFIYHSIYLSILFVQHIDIYLSIYLSIYHSWFISISLIISIYLSIYLSISQLIHIYQSNHINLSIYVYYLSITADSYLSV